MNKNTLAAILSVAASIFVMIGVGLSLCFMYEAERDRQIINVGVESGEDKTVRFEGLHLAPGDRTEYTVNLTNKTDGPYEVSLDIEEQTDLGLKHFVYARIEANGEVLCDKLLSEVFEDAHYEFSVTSDRKRDCVIRITYYMPESVGNDAKNTESVFDMTITATNAEDFYE